MCVCVGGGGEIWLAEVRFEQMSLQGCFRCDGLMNVPNFTGISLVLHFYIADTEIKNTQEVKKNAF